MRMWRFDSESMDLGVVETKRCDSCEEDRSFKLFLNHRYAHIAYFCSWMLQKKYLLLCDICHRGGELDWRKVETKLHTHATSLQRRHGWRLLGAVVAIVVVWVAGSEPRPTDNRSISGTHADAVYVVGLLQVLQRAGIPRKDGTTRAKADEEVELLWPPIGYRKSAGSSNDVGNGKARDSAYDGVAALESVRRD